MRRRISIAWKLIIVYLIVGIPLATVIALTYRAWYLAEIQTVVLDRTELARLTGISFSLLTSDIEHTMKSTGQAIVANDYSESEARAALEDLVKDYPISNAVLTDPSGRVVASVDRRFLGRNFAGHPAFKAIIEDKARSGIEPTEASPIGVGFHLTQAIIRRGRLEAIAASFVDVRKLHHALPVRIGEGGANVVDSTGHVVFQSEFPNVAAERAYWGDLPIVKQALGGKTATSTDIALPPTGQTRIGAEVPIRDIGWASGSFIDFDTAIGPVRRSVVAAMLASIVIALVALAVSILIARGIIDSLAKLVTRAKAVGEGRFDEPVTLETGDEVEDVARSLDETRLNLKRYVEGLAGVAEAGRLLTSSLELELVKTAITNSIQRLFGPHAIFAALYNKKTGRLEILLWEGPGAEEFSSVSFKPGEGVIGRVFETKQPAVVPDLQAEPRFILKEKLTEYGMKSAIELPLIVGDTPIGVLGLFWPEVRKAGPESREMELLDVLASETAIALENARLYNETVEGSRRQVTAYEIGKVLSSTLELDDLLRAVLQELTQAVQAETGSFYFYDRESETIRGQVGYGIEDQVIRSIVEPVELFKGLKDALLEDRPLSVTRETVSEAGRRYMDEYGIVSTLILPLVFKKTPIGVAFVSRLKGPEVFYEEDVEFAMLIARQAAIAVENARLFSVIERTASSEHARREELEAVINSMEDGVAVIDTAGGVSMVNPFGQEIIEMGKLTRPEELDLSHVDGAPIAPEDLPSSKALRGERVSGFEVIIGAKKGRPRILSVSAAPFHDRAGRIAGAAVIYRDVTEQRRAEQDLRRRNRELQIISEISASLARTLDLQQLIEQVADKTMPLLETDAVAFYLLDEESRTLKLVVSRGLSDEFVREASEIRVGEKLTGITAETGLPIAVEDLRTDTRTANSLMAREGLVSFASVPIKSRGRVVGVMPLATRAQRRFSDRDLALLSSIGNQIGTAIENAQLYAAERDIAETLQESLLGSAPELPGFEIGVVYEPAFEVAQVGGDFFDFIEFADGKIAVVLGDVSGKGLKAATLTAMAKNTVRAFAYEDNAPKHVLSRTNEVMAAETGPNEFVTLLFVLLDIPANVIRMGTAGHPLPFYCDGQCMISTGEYGLPLGAFARVSYGEFTIDLEPNQSLILYTDGLTDARSDASLFGDAGIGRTASAFKDLSAQDLAEKLVDAARDFAGGKLQDDVAVIVLKMKG